jgi:hypothetical protein
MSITGYPVHNSSGAVANAQAVATLAGVAGLLTYVTGFEITAAGATVGLAVNAVLSGTSGGSQSFIFTAPVGVAVGAVPLIVQFPEAVPASAVNTSIVLTMPALGAGNLAAAVTLHGYRITP